MNYPDIVEVLMIWPDNNTEVKLVYQHKTKDFSVYISNGLTDMPFSDPNHWTPLAENFEESDLATQQMIFFFIGLNNYKALRADMIKKQTLIHQKILREAKKRIEDMKWQRPSPF